MKIGVLGGMFDPVHVGHLRAGLEAREALGLDEIRLLPCGRPVHRAPLLTGCAQRTAMLELAVRDLPGFCVDTRECERPGPSYMVDTLASLRTERPDDALYLLLGTDTFHGLPSWHRWTDLFGLAHLAVLSRPGEGGRASGDVANGDAVNGGAVNGDAGAAGAEPELLRAACMGRRVAPGEERGPAGAVIALEMLPLAISSTRVRALLGAGRSVRFLLPDAVLDYIEHHNLYAATCA